MTRQVMSRLRMLTSFLLLFAFATSAFAAKKPKNAIPQPNDEKAGGPFLLNTPEGPVLQFPVIHIHGMSRCYGYLQVSEKAIRFEVTSGEADHAFLYAHSEIRAKKSHGEIVTLFLPRGRFDLIPTNRHMLESRNMWATRANARDPGRIVTAINDFELAIEPFYHPNPQGLAVAAGTAPAQPTAQPANKPGDLQPEPDALIPRL